MAPKKFQPSATGFIQVENKAIEPVESKTEAVEVVEAVEKKSKKKSEPVVESEPAPVVEETVTVAEEAVAVEPASEPTE